MLKIVLDANVLASATISPKGIPAQIIKTWREKKFKTIVSRTLLEEIERIIFYPKIRKYSTWSEQEIQEFLKELLKVSIKAPGKLKLQVVKKDPPDDHYIIAAVEKKADYIVSGNKHLLELKEYQEVKIISPAEFLKIIIKK